MIVEKNNKIDNNYKIEENINIEYYDYYSNKSDKIEEES